LPPTHPLDSQPAPVPRDEAVSAIPAAVPATATARRPWPLSVYARWLRETSFRRHLNVAVTLSAFCLALLVAAVNAWQGGRNAAALLHQHGAHLAAALPGIDAGHQQGQAEGAQRDHHAEMATKGGLPQPARIDAQRPGSLRR